MNVEFDGGDSTSPLTQLLITICDDFICIPFSTILDILVNERVVFSLSTTVTRVVPRPPSSSTVIATVTALVLALSNVF